MNIYEEVTEKIIMQLENRQIPWIQPWKNGAYAWSRATGKAYSILNSLLLAPGEYATFNQISKEGGKVFKGSKAYKVLFYKPITVEDTSEEKPKVIPILQHFLVYNVATQTTLSLKHNQNGSEVKPIEAAEDLINNYVCRENICLKNSSPSSQAFYNMTKDEIVVPQKSQFNSIEAYYNTVFHEMAHSTGHSSRLNRPLKGYIADKDSYSKEELIAELTAASLCCAMGIDTGATMQDNLSYIQGWLNVLQNDKTMIVKAASKSGKAFDYIMEGLKIKSK